MTFTEITIQDAAELRLPDRETASPPAEPRDDHDRLLRHLERRANLIELIAGRERAIDDAYESRAENRIVWARTEGAETLRILRGALLSCNATIKHLCQEIGKEAK